jgi:hypothetical protein
MFRNHRLLAPTGILLFGLGAMAGNAIHFLGDAKAQPANRVFELRTYTAHPGRLAELHARFGDHTVQLFERHGMTNVGYFQPQDAPLSENTLIYLLAHDSREAAEASWEAFRNDPDWQRVAEESRRNGRLVANVESVFLDPTSYSKMR